jgi:hypothetical protein
MHTARRNGAARPATAEEIAKARAIQGVVSRLSINRSIHKEKLCNENRRKVRQLRRRKEVKAQLDIQPMINLEPIASQSQEASPRTRDSENRIRSNSAMSTTQRSRSEDDADETDIANLDDVASLYSTSSSQRSADRKNDGGKGQQELLEKVKSKMKTKRAKTRSVAGNVTNVNAKLALMKEKAVLCVMPFMRMTGAYNQLRLETCPRDPQGDEIARAATITPRIPPEKMTAQLRARLSRLNPAEREEICLLDEYGAERIPADSKLYQCYFGRV